MEPVLGYFLSAFVSAVIAKLVNKGLTFFPNRSLRRQKLDRLNQLLPTIQSILTAVEPLPWRATRDWHDQLTELKDAVYAADDVLDDLEYNLLKRESSKIKKFLYGSIGFDMLEKTVDHIERVVSDFIRTFQFLSSVPEHHEQDTQETTSLLPQADVPVREGEVRQILGMLEGVENFQYRSGFGVLSIVGPAGIGKTHLAQSIYHHEFVKREFPMRIWVYVSDDFDVKTLTVKMIRRASDGEQLLPHRDYDSLEDAHADLIRLLTGKRFMLVLDDIWKEISFEHWDNLCKPFRLAAERSIVLLTSQIHSVAKQIATMGQVALRGLEMDDYWPLFKHCAFGEEDPAEHSNLGKNIGETSKKVKEMSGLEEIGWKIAGRMDGSPLAAKLLGSVLRRNKDKDHWNQILRSDLWGIDEYIISPSLLLSYKHLNGQLKHCFVYCALFPIGYIFEKEKLVQMWVAQGFIPPSDGKTPEDVGNRCFEELVNRSFFQPVWNDKYMMHSLIHELAQSIGSDEFFTVADRLQGIPLRTAPHIAFSSGTARHVTVRTDDLVELERALENNNINLKRLRTILFFGGYKDSKKFCILLNSIFQQAKSIRVLDLSHTCMRDLPSSINNLKHLRYLDLCGNRVTSLPRRLCSLYHLQVLNVKWCPVQQLPKKMNRLINLRYISADRLTISIISQILKLTNFQGLRGPLHVKDLHLVKVREAKEGIFKQSKHLTSLWLSWDSEGQGIRKVDDARTTALDEKVLQSLQPHDNLKELRIDSYVGLGSPTWMLKSTCLSNVKSMYLIGCLNWQNLPPLELLPELEILEIKGMHALKEVSSQSLSHDSVNKGFPRLKRLSIDDLPKLKVWTAVQDAQFFPCLCELVVRNCPTLERFPYILKLENVILENVGVVSLIAFFNACCPEVSLPESSSSSSKGIPLAFPTISSMYISKCPNLISFGESSNQLFLPQLFELEIRNCPQFSSQSLGHDSVKRGFPRLEKLSIDGLPNLKEWTGVQYGQFFPCLCELVVRNCPTLERFPYIPQLKKVILENVGLVSLISFFNACLPEVTLPESSSSSSKGIPLAFPTIISMCISKCPNLISFGESSNQLFLPRLSVLEIRNCPQLCSLPDLPPTLTRLIIEDAGLKELPRIQEKGLTGGVEMVEAGSFLSTLYISSCPKLSTLSIGLFRQQQLLRRLGKLSLRNCENLKSDLDGGFKAHRGFKGLTALKELAIFDCPKLFISHVPVSLKTIEVSECFITQGAWFGYRDPLLHSIETVKIIGCPHANSDEDHNLKIPDSFKHLTSVDRLYLANTSVLTLGLFTKLHSLIILDIDGCKGFLTDEPQVLHFSKLQHLSIRNCKELPYLPEDLITRNSLMELWIENCPLITTLPKNDLPRSLERLSIRGCNPLLKNRCLDANHYFPKISYIPSICIEGELLKSRDWQHPGLIVDEVSEA